MELSQRVQNLIKELGRTINETLHASPDVRESISRIQNEGYDPFLLLEATVGLREAEGDKRLEIRFEDEIEIPRVRNERRERSERSARLTVPRPKRRETGSRFILTPDDRAFLRDFRIRADDDAK